MSRIPDFGFRIRRGCRSALSAALACGVLLSAGTACADIEVFVAPWGDDANPGSAAKPFKTPFAARDAVRKIVARGLSCDVTVWFREGRYLLTAPLAMGPADSGTTEHSITYAAYGDERVELTCGAPVGGWTVYSNRILQAAIPPGIEPRQVFEDGMRLVLARRPDKEYLAAPAEGDYLRVEEPLDDVGGEFRYGTADFPGALDPAGWDFSDAGVFIWAGSDRNSRNLRIGSLDAARRSITLLPVAGLALRRRDRYFVENVLALLDAPGECQVSLAKRRLYVWPRGGNKPPEISVPAADSVIVVEGDASNLVLNVHFRGLDLGICNADVVRIRNAEGCSVRFCTVENGGACGVAVSEHARGITVYGNLVRYNGSHGVSLLGAGPGGADVNRDNRVENNRVHHCGRLDGNGCGVALKFSGHNVIAHNLVHDMPRHGVLLEDVTYARLCELVMRVARDARYDHLYTRNNAVEFNEIFRVNADSQDAGAVEAWNAGRDNACRNNVIHDVGNPGFTLESGVCIGDGTDFFSVSSNVIRDVAGRDSCCVRANGVRNAVRNNILVASPGTRAMLRVSAWNDDTARLDFSRNIFCMPRRDATVFLFMRWHGGIVAACDENVYWKPRGGEILFDGKVPARNLKEWRSLAGGRFDAHSVIADPKFEDVARGDFKLKRDSPALKLGFGQVDALAAGLKADFPARFPRK